MLMGDVTWDNRDSGMAGGDIRIFLSLYRFPFIHFFVWNISCGDRLSVPFIFFSAAPDGSRFSQKKKSGREWMKGQEGQNLFPAANYDRMTHHLYPTREPSTGPLHLLLMNERREYFFHFCDQMWKYSLRLYATLRQVQLPLLYQMHRIDHDRMRGGMKRTSSVMMQLLPCLQLILPLPSFPSHTSCPCCWVPAYG